MILEYFLPYDILMQVTIFGLVALLIFFLFKGIKLRWLILLAFLIMLIFYFREMNLSMLSSFKKGKDLYCSANDSHLIINDKEWEVKGDLFINKNKKIFLPNTSCLNKFYIFNGIK